MSSAKRRLAIGAAGLVVLAGSGGAYAATQSGSTTTPQRPDPAAQQKAFLDDVAKRLNVTSDQLNAAVKGAAEDQIDAAVAAGKLTKDQGDAAKKRIESAQGAGIGGFGLGFGFGGPHGPGGGPGRPGGPGGLGFGLDFGF